MDYKIIEIDKDKSTYLQFKTLIKNNYELEPILELYKGKLFLYIIKIFINDCITYLGKKIFSVKKSYVRTITNLLASWIFYLYITYDFEMDYFFPTNYTDTISLENTLRDLCKYDKTITDIDIKINNILNNLKQNYKYQLELLNTYKKSALFINNKTNYYINKKIIKLENIIFYKFNIKTLFTIKDYKLCKIINNILIPETIYNKFKSNYTGPINKMDEYIWIIIYRYQLLGSNNHQLAVLPSIMLNMKNDLNLNFECFASSINRTFNNYCSIYYDVEQYFGSYGNFFNIIPIEGTFGFNPPYQKDIIDIGIHKIIDHLDNSKKTLTFIITIPIWDNNGKNYMKEIYNNNLEKQNIDYGDFDIINKIKISKYFKKIKLIPKEKFTYIDHNFLLYKNKTIQNTYIIVLSNTDHQIEYFDKIDEYNYFET
jgi:hypothetical protein